MLYTINVHNVTDQLYSIKTGKRGKQLAIKTTKSQGLYSITDNNNKSNNNK